MATKINLNGLRAVSAAKPAASQQTEVSLEYLGSLQVAGKTDYTIPFPVVCGHRNGSVFFFADLVDGQRFFVAPVMPRSDIDGSIMAPDNGSRGTLTVAKSDNAKVVKDQSGRISFTIRPEFVSFEPVSE